MDAAFRNDDRTRPDGSRGFRGNAENAKTRLCTRWLQGDCRFGERCNFAHGEAELRKGGAEGGAAGGYGQGGMGGGRGGGRVGGGYPARGPGGPMGGGYPGPGRGRGMYGGDMGYGGGYGGSGGYGMAQPAYGAPLDHGRPTNMPEEVWAAQGYPVAGPNGWYMYRTKENGEPYYHNHRTGQTIWERPPEWAA